MLINQWDGKRFSHTAPDGAYEFLCAILLQT